MVLLFVDLIIKIKNNKKNNLYSSKKKNNLPLNFLFYISKVLYGVVSILCDIVKYTNNMKDFFFLIFILKYFYFTSKWYFYIGIWNFITQPYFFYIYW